MSSCGETVISVVGLLLKIYLFKHDEDLIKHSNTQKKLKENQKPGYLALSIITCFAVLAYYHVVFLTSNDYIAGNGSF